MDEDLSTLLYKKEDSKILNQGLTLLSQGLTKGEENKLFFAFFDQVTRVLTALYAIAECTDLTYMEICQILKGVTSNSLLKAAEDFQNESPIFDKIKKYLAVDNQTMVAILSNSGDKVSFNLEAFFDKRHFFRYIPIFRENLKLAVSENCFIDRLKKLYCLNLYEHFHVSFGVSEEKTKILVSHSFPIFEAYYKKNKHIEEIFNKVLENKEYIIEIGGMLRRIPNAQGVQRKFHDILFGEIDNFSNSIFYFYNGLQTQLNRASEVLAILNNLPDPLRASLLEFFNQHVAPGDFIGYCAFYDLITTNLPGGAQIIQVPNFFHDQRPPESEQLNSSDITKCSSSRIDDRR